MLKQTPSEYMREKGLSLPDAVRNFGYRAHQPQIIALAPGSAGEEVGEGAGGSTLKACSVPIDKPLFQPFPSNLLLQSFQPFQTYQVLVQFRNMDKVARKLRLEPLNSPFFELVGVKNSSLQSGKIAPGMEFPVHIKFTPEENIDYSCNIVCCTAREKFILPVLAIGARASLEFPDQVEFARVPVKHATMKTLLVCNVGTRDAKFTLTTKAPFSVEPAQGFLAIGKSMQVHVSFECASVGDYAEELLVHYDTGELVFVNLLASAQDINIRLESITANFDPSSVSLSTFKVIRIHNRSDIMSKYSWKAMPNQEAEETHLSRKMQELEAREQADVARAKASLAADPQKLAFELSNLSQSYKNARRDLRKGTLAFEDEVFSIEPATGSVWPNNVAEFKAFFRPIKAGVHVKTAYCDIAGRESRLPLTLKGEAFGPVARFSFDILDISSVFINTLHRYELLLENHSDIPLQYSLLESSSAFSRKFKFYPSKGEVAVGATQSITISFESDTLGSFDEEILWMMQGATAPMPLRILGKVEGPAFHLDAVHLDFGHVAYGFTYRKEVELTNECDIPLDYRARVLCSGEGEAAGHAGHFVVHPAECYVPPHGQQRLTVQFTASSTLPYAARLVLDVEGVQEEMKSLPITAQATVPKVKVETTYLEFGGCFIQHPYQGEVRLTNPTDFPARYELEEQEVAAKSVYTYTSTNGRGIIPPHSTLALQLEVTTKRLDVVEFPIFLRVGGAEDSPHAVDIYMRGIGPNVLFSADQVNWGRVPVLQEVESAITLTNNSPVPAGYHVEFGADSSVFSVDPAAGTIAPQGQATLTFRAFCDDAAKFDKVANVVIADDRAHEVRLLARGQGTTVVCDKDISRVDFGRVFCDTEVEFSFVLHNQGRRTQQLSWLTESTLAKTEAGAEVTVRRSLPALRMTSRGSGASGSEGERAQVFAAHPARLTLKPGAREVVIFRGRFPTPITAREALVCYVATHDKEEKGGHRKIMGAEVSADFILPTITHSASQRGCLEFVQAFDQHTPFATLTQDFVLTNDTALPLDVTLACTVPFSVAGLSVKTVHLEPKARFSTAIHLDTTHNADRISRNIKSMLAISYLQHGQRDDVPLFSSLQFHNLSLSTAAVDFGYIPNDTWAKRTFTMSNHGKLAVPYAWSFHRPRRPSTSPDARATPIHQIFDMTPVSGIIEPGTSEEVVVTFFGHADGVYDIVAVCDTYGGPAYEVQLAGRASHIAYEFAERSIEFGHLHYQAIQTRELVLRNVGLVALHYSCFFPRHSKLGERVVVSPASGQIPPGESFPIQVSFCLLLPETVEDFFYVQVEHYQPDVIRFAGVGVCPQLEFAGQLEPATGGREEEHGEVSAPAHLSSCQRLYGEAEAAKRFRERTMAFVESLVRALPVDLEATSNRIGSPLLMHKVYSRREQRRKTGGIPELSAITAMEYTCSCHNVIQGTVVRKHLAITNPGKTPITLTVDKNAWAGSGFFVELDRGTKIVPRGEVVDLVYGYQGRADGESQAQLRLPVQIVGGPNILLHLSAGMCLPMFEFASPAALDFGEVLVGMRKSIPVVLHNPYSVECAWSTKPPSTEEVQGVRKTTALTRLPRDLEFLPDAGVLRPEERVTVLVRLVPQGNKTLDTLIPFYIHKNPKPMLLAVRGRGVKPEVRLEPGRLAFDPVIPWSEVVERRVTIRNPTSFPLEVYSVECDRKHLEEQAWLRSQSGFQRGVLYLPPRECGVPLGSEGSVAMATSLSHGLGQSEDGGMGGAASGGRITAPSRTSDHQGGSHPNAEAVLKQLVKHMAPAPGREGAPELGAEPSYVNIILHGPPLCGKTTQAHLLAQKFGLPVLSVDEVLKSQVPVAPAERPPGRQAVWEGAALPEAVAKVSGTEGEGLSDSQLPEDVVFDLLKARLERVDCAKGFIIDGLVSRYSRSSVHMLNAVLEHARRHHHRVAFFHLQLDFAHVRAREFQFIKRTLQEELASMKVKDISEEEYDALPAPERTTFNQRALEYKRRLKEVQEAVALYKRNMGAEANQRVGQSNAEEEAKVKTKGSKGHKKAKEAKVAKASGVVAAAPAVAVSASVAAAPVPIVAALKAGGDAPRRGISTPSQGAGKREKGAKLDKAPSQGHLTPNESCASLFAEGNTLDFFQTSDLTQRYEMYHATLDKVLPEVQALAEKERLRAAAAAKSSTNPTAAGGSVEPTKRVLTGHRSSRVMSAVSQGGEYDDEEDISNQLLDEIPCVSMGELLALDKEDKVQVAVLKFLASLDVLFPNSGSRPNHTLLPPFFLEQAFQFPLERAPRQLSKKFSIIPDPVAGFGAEGGVVTTLGEDIVNPLPVLEKEKPGAHVTSVKKGGQVAKNAKQLHEDTKQAEAEAEREKDVAAAAAAAASYRWVIPPNESKDIVVRFMSEEIGTFGQDLTFEIAGFKGEFVLPATGQCRYPSFAADYKSLFPKNLRKLVPAAAAATATTVTMRVATPEPRPDFAQLNKPAFNVEGNFYDFGHLSCLKSKDRFHERFPENRASVTIRNPTASEISVSCAFLKGDTMFLEHASVLVPAGQASMVSVWAYPRAAGTFEDFLILCVKDNPQPTCIKYACVGVKPELEVDRKQLTFDKVLVGRTETKELRIRNPSQLPVTWRLAGLETAADEFLFSHTDGKLDPGCDMVVGIEFKASKSSTVRRMVRVEVVDVDRTGVQTPEYPVMIMAEAHEVSVDMHYPKGQENGLDFGKLRVFEEQRHVITVKNKGRYEVGYRIVFEDREMADYFSLTPPQGVIQPSEKITSIQCVFRAHKEVHYQESLQCRCEFFDIATGGLLSSQVIRLSAHTYFTKFSLFPVRDLNFGVVINGVRSTKQFTVENNGEFDLRFLINRLTGQPKGQEDGAPGSKAPGAAGTNAGGNAASGPGPGLGAGSLVNRPFLGKEGNRKPETMNFGAFTIFPTSGIVAPGAKLAVAVEFHPETTDCFEEVMGIDISDRPPESCEPVEYRLIGESCITGINTTDLPSIFEEHLIIKRLEGHHAVGLGGGNLYAEEDRVFHFGAHLVGKTAQARFKISNCFKIPCEVNLSVKPKNKAVKVDSGDFAFEVEPKKLVLPGHEHRYVTVSFNPQSLQTYNGIFECITEGSGPSAAAAAAGGVEATKSKVLTFDVRGEGAIPHVIISSPPTKSKANQTLLQFRRLMTGQSQTQVVVFKNDGIVNSTFSLEWIYKDDFFQSPSMNQSYTLSPQESRSVEFQCRPTSVRKAEAELRVWVVDNGFEETTLLLHGEGYVDDLAFELPSEEEAHLRLADCFVGVERRAKFGVRSYSSEVTRVSFATQDEQNHEFPVAFVPSTFHLKPGARRTITAVWHPKAPAELKATTVSAKLLRIRPSTKESSPGATVPVSEWDDKMRVYRWMTEVDGKSRQVAESIPEPAYEMVGGAAARSYPLTVSGVADYSTYECDLKVALFKRTFMYQSRAITMTLRNTGAVVLQYDFAFRVRAPKTPPEGAAAVASEAEASELPFTVTPTSGSILAGESQLITIHFQPQEVVDLKVDLVGTIANLREPARSLVIPVHGVSQRPFCHFELEPNLFRISSEEEIWRKVDADPETKVLEFSSCGIKVRNTKRFYIVNPTSASYTFEWEQGNPTSQVQLDKSFKCITPRGSIEPGKKFELVFEFTPTSTALVEARWTFRIPEHSISVPFYLVGKAYEPNVYLDKGCVNFKPVLVGKLMKETVHLVNEEKIPLSFAFGEIPLEVGASGAPVTRISPMQGTIGPMSSLPIDVTLTPGAEKMYSINVPCIIKKKPTPLQMNIKGEGYEIHDQILCEAEDGSSLFELSSPAMEATADFGAVQLNDKKTRKLSILNSGKYNFDYSWKLSKPCPGITVAPEFGSVGRGERQYCEICWQPTNPTILKDVVLVCQINNGKRYKLNITGTGRRPMLRVSQLEHDFGTQFVSSPGLSPAHHVFRLTNEDSQPVTYEVLQTESSSTCFELPKGLVILAPGGRAELDVSFYPKEAKAYVEEVLLEVNGLSAIPLRLQGQGAAMRIQASSSDLQILNFGPLRIGHTVTKATKLVNKSAIPVTFTLGPQAVVDRLTGHGVTFATKEYTLRPKGVANVDFKFQPTQRMAAFVYELCAESPGYSMPVVSVQGACHGVDVRLESDTLPFGAIVQRSRTSRKIQLQNVGDIGVRFAWDPAHFLPDFFINPAEGFIAAGTGVALEVTFCPKLIHPDIRYERLACTIEGGGKLYLTLTGTCIPQPVSSDLRFSTPVRQSETKGIQLTNKSNAPWNIRPIIDNPTWSGVESMEIEAGQTKTYDLTYSPMEMRAKEEGGISDEGSIFFPLPDGTGNLYKLYGCAERPAPAGTLTLDVPCKTTYQFTLPVANWLKKPQCFKVLFDAGRVDPSIQLRGNEFLEVPGMVTREYKVQAFVYKESVINAKVTFRNETTQEYLFYNLVLRVGPPQVAATIDLTTPIRQVAVREVSIHNPLPTPTQFTTTCTNTDVVVPHTFTIPPKSDGMCTLEYLPLIPPKELNAHLSITSVELGSYLYDLVLGATPPPPERPLQFKAGLGNSCTMTFRFISFCKTKTEFACRIEHPDFSTERSVFSHPPAAGGSSSGGVEVSVDVVYEPSHTGDVRTQLLVSSPTGGDYACLLVGQCSPPRPQGPIFVKGSAATNLQFKNVLTTSCTFNFTIDNVAFSVKPNETIAPKKIALLSITYKAAPGASKTGKLTISTPGSPVTWTYYLKYNA